jgi:hypothetical protein
MTTRVVTILKYFGFLSIVFFTLISCEKEIEGIGVDIIDNSKFTPGIYVSSVLAANKNVDSVPANNIEQYLLGSYADSEFGALKGSIVSQLLPPAVGDYYSYGTNAGIDSVLIFIPYQVTQLDDDDDGKPVFKIDSVIGNDEVKFKLGVYELETFLNSLNPENPTQNMVYYSDKVFQKKSIPFYAEDFKINHNDTVAYIKRYMPDGVTVYDIDTVKQANSAPTIKLPLNEEMIQEIFVDDASGSQFSSIESFIHYFRGFYLEASEDLTNRSQLVSLNMTLARMVIYYSNDQDESDNVDLDGNGVTGETAVRVPMSYEFYFGNVKSNVLTRDYTISKESGPDRLYVQGAAGSLATIDLFVNEDLDELRSKDLLITDASITVYVDQNSSSDILPEQLFIYNYEDNTQIIDMFTEGLSRIGGSLERDDDGKGYKYVFRITDYISRVLSPTDPIELSTLGIKVYNPTDSPSSLLDTTVPEYSWIPRGVVLYNQNGDNAGNYKIEFEIKYTELKTN